MTNYTPISVTYTDQHLRILIEEFIAMQRSEFSFKGVCSYILYRAMEECRTANNGMYESNQLEQKDCDRVRDVLEKILAEGRLKVIISEMDSMTDDTKFEVINNG